MLPFYSGRKTNSDSHSSDVEASTLSYQAEDAHVSISRLVSLCCFEADLLKLLTIEGETIESSLSEIGAIYAQFIEQHRPNFLNEVSISYSNFYFSEDSNYFSYMIVTYLDVLLT